MNTKITKSDFDKICRICLLKKTNMMSLWNVSGIVDMIQACTSIQIRKCDNLPSQICRICIDKITEVYAFKLQCESFDRLLHRILNDDDKNWFKQEGNIDTKEVVYIKNDIQDLDDNDTLTNINFQLDDSVASDFDRKNHENDTEQDMEPIAPVASEPQLQIKDDCDQDITLNVSNIYLDSENEIVRLKEKKRLRLERAKHLDSEKCDRETLTCKICNKVLVNIYSLGRHMERHDEKRQFHHYCSVCKKGFYEKGHLTKHMRRHKGETRYSCEKCSKKFYELSALAVHMRKHRTEPIPCRMCDKKFMVKLQLDIHMKIHNPEVHTCDKCGKTFDFISSLKSHQTTHLEENIYPCLLCDKSFKYVEALKRHHKRCHLGERSMTVCNICGKNVVELRTHMLTHSSERPFACTHCPKSYASRTLLNQHCRKKHDENPVKRPYLCSICGKGSITSTALQNHILHMHTSGRLFPCPICNKKFKTDKIVKVHIRFTHNNERPYTCSVCSKSFQTRSTLKTHTRTHTGERPFTCKPCGKAFSQASTLRTHMKVHGFETIKVNKISDNDTHMINKE